MIQHFSFKHKGGFYHFRLHNQKNLKNGFSNLKTYLEKIHEKCPNCYFNEGPRSSSLKFKLQDVNQIHLKNHEISELAKLGLEINEEKYNTNHSKVQVFMLERDNKTLAIEVPIWLEQEELQGFFDIFKTNKPLTGHIDILRLEGDKIWVLDYKPNALKEKYASTQVFFYALMLSKRTNIPLENFRCGYFDDKDTFLFKPDLNQINRNRLTSYLQ